MNIYYSLLQFIFFIAQSQESWKTIYQEFTGSNWDDSRWFISLPYGGPFSQCGNQKLFGGFSVFGFQTLISSQFILPSHYQLRISLDLWNWDGEIVKMAFDSEIREKSFILTDGLQICGRTEAIFLEQNIPFVIPISHHHSKSIVVIMTSTLNQPADDESWGFQNLQIEILECPLGCVFCTDSISSCKFWKNVEQYEFGKSPEEGWLINGSQQVVSSDCNGIRILGGINILQKGQGVVKFMESIIPHFKVQIMVKIWAIGEWQNELFSLDIDGKPSEGIEISSDNFIYSQCQEQKVRIVNYDVNQFHSSPSIKLSMKTSKSIETIAHWGFQSIEMFVAICAIGCQTCTGELASQCIICLQQWIKIDIGCIDIFFIHQISPSFRMLLSSNY